MQNQFWSQYRSTINRNLHSGRWQVFDCTDAIEYYEVGSIISVFFIEIKAHVKCINDQFLHLEICKKQYMTKFVSASMA